MKKVLTNKAKKARKLDTTNNSQCAQFGKDVFRFSQSFLGEKMPEYLIDWWNGKLVEYNYGLIGLTIPQINKIAKIILYAVTLSTVFEYIKYKELISTLKKNSKLSLYVIFLVRTLITSPFIFFGFFLGLIFVVFKQLRLREVPLFAVSYQVSEAHRRATKQAESHISIWIMDWFEEQPITEFGIKKFGFILIVIFALIEVFTS